MAKDEAEHSTAAAEPVLNEVDRDFLAWAKEHADHDRERMAQALADTAYLMRRSRKLQTETARAWLRSCVAESMQRGFPKSAAVVDTREKIAKWLGWVVSERAIWRAFVLDARRHNSCQSK